jgi:hypothetical protein
MNITTWFHNFITEKKRNKQVDFLQTLKCTTTPVGRWMVCTERLERGTERWTICKERLERWTERWTVCTEWFDRRTERWTLCTEWFEQRTVGTVWTLWSRFQNLHFGNSRYLLISSLIFIYTFTNIKKSLCRIIYIRFL